MRWQSSTGATRVARSSPCSGPTRTAERMRSSTWKVGRAMSSCLGATAASRSSPASGTSGSSWTRWNNSSLAARPMSPGRASTSGRVREFVWKRMVTKTAWWPSELSSPAIRPNRDRLVIVIGCLLHSTHPSQGACRKHGVRLRRTHNASQSESI